MSISKYVTLLRGKWKSKNSQKDSQNAKTLRKGFSGEMTYIMISKVTQCYSA